MDLCHYVFMNEKYDEAVLRYLVVCFEGSTKEMYLLWRAAKRFDLETHKLEERLLTQILFFGMLSGRKLPGIPAILSIKFIIIYWYEPSLPIMHISIWCICR